MMRCLFMLLLLTTNVLAQASEELEAELQKAKDAQAARELLAAAYDRGEVRSVLDAFLVEDRIGNLLNWREGPAADPLTAVVLQDARVIRFLAGRLDHPDPKLRLSSARLCRWSNWPYLAQAVLERCARETDAVVQQALLNAMHGTLKEDELRVAWRTKALHADAERARLHALFRLALARAGLTHRVQAWPGGPDWPERGFTADRARHPFRSLISNTLSIPRPQNREPVLLILGYVLDGEAAGRFEARLSDQDLGGHDLKPGRGLQGVRLVSLPLTKTEEVGGDLRLDFADDTWQRFQFRALVGFESALDKVGEAFVTRRLLPGDGLEVEGAEPDSELRPGLVIEGERARFVISDLEARGKIHSFELDHWSEDKGGSVWEVALNGKVLMQLIGQPRPRAAKCNLRNLNLEKGKNVVELRRLSGQQLHVESIRLRFE